MKDLIITICSSITPVIGIVIALFIWQNSKFNVKSICVQFTVMSYLFMFCMLYLADHGHLIVERSQLDLTIRLLSLLGLICTSTHLFYLTRKLNATRRNKKENKRNTVPA